MPKKKIEKIEIHAVFDPYKGVFTTFRLVNYAKMNGRFRARFARELSRQRNIEIKKCLREAREPEKVAERKVVEDKAVKVAARTKLVKTIKLARGF